MLYIKVKEIPKDCIINVNSYFNRHKRKDWFNREDVKDAIFRIDKTIAVKDEYLESPVFGGMAPERLSGGCKAVILMMVTDLTVYATKCGDNCVPLIEEIAQRKDLHIVLHHPMPFSDSISAIMEETGEIVNSKKEWIYAYYRVRHNR